MTLCTVILAGGKSTRMGRNKALLTLGMKPIIEHIVSELQPISDKLVVVANEPDDYTFLGVPIVRDRYKNKGPLAGIEAAMYQTEADQYVIAACDMPFIDRNIYKYLLTELYDFTAVIPLFDGKVHPLTSIYRREALPHIQAQLENNDLQVTRLATHIRINYVSQFAGVSTERLQRHFFNMNDPSEYERAKTDYTC
ncbi:MAG TPA: molybdenum cofactor guanylyltransferase [Bacillota bacterium]